MTDLLKLNLCPPPFLDSRNFTNSDGFIPGRLCEEVAPGIKCCLPCPLTDWVYPDSFNTLTQVANWASAVSVICLVFLLLSWACLPVDKTNRHYLSICLSIGVLLMSLGFVVPLAAKPDQCFDEITPHSMSSSKVCGASGSLLIVGGWAGVMWAFLRSLSLHLQICWQVLVGRNFMIFAQFAGWGVPLIGITLALVFSGVSFRFGPTCHINHQNSLADLWIPLLIFAGITVVCTFVTFGYCVKVYLASLADSAESTEGSNLPASTNSIRTMTPRQAYRRVRRVIALQWRGIAIVLIIAADVIFFSIIFVFQDNVVQSVSTNPKKAQAWINCLIQNRGQKNMCLEQAGSLAVNEATVGAVLLLLALNGVWLLFLLGRWSMVTGWIDLLKLPFTRGNKKEFVSVDARAESKPPMTSYEMLSRTPNSLPIATRRQDRHPTPDYFKHDARGYTNPGSYSSPRPPPRTWEAPRQWDNSPQQWVNQQQWHAQQQRSASPTTTYSTMSHATEFTARPTNSTDELNPLGMNRI